ncbi:MAG: PilZ domain-containing protein [Elusimicrobia bacterium]|nr:PilZ domain-containing protein [Elusimicrobiota bacterium]
MAIFFDSDPDIRERRRQQRYEHSLPMALYDDDEELLDEDTSLRNLSVRGLGFVTIQGIKPGERARFKIGLSGHGILSGTVRICWSTSDRAGVSTSCGGRIESIDIFNRWRLRKFLQPRTTGKEFGILDALLGTGCCWVVYKIAEQVGLLQSRSTEAWLGEILGVLPFGLISVGCLVGIIFLLKLKR